MEMAFDCPNYLEIKKVKLAAIESPIMPLFGGINY